MLCKCLQTHQKKGGALKRSHCKRVLVTTWKQAAYKLSGAISSLSSFKRVPGPLLRQHCTCSNRQHYSDVIHKQVRSGPLWALLSWPGVPGKKMTLKARHIPDRLNVMADKLGQTIQTEWSLLPEVFQAIYSRWHWPQIDHEVQQQVASVSLLPDLLATAVDALSLPWEDLDTYAFPPTAILGKVVEKLQDSPCNRIILIAPGWT